MSMLLSEYRKAELEAYSTAGTGVGKTIALSLLLLLSQPTTWPAAITGRRFAPGGTIGTAAEVLSLRITEADLFFQISRIYDDLLKNQIDLDIEAKRALLSNLWDLYS
jgi:hypothetical protein